MYRTNRKKGQEVSRGEKRRKRFANLLFLAGLGVLILPAVGLAGYYGGTFGSRWVNRLDLVSARFLLERVRVTGTCNLTEEDAIRVAGVRQGQRLLDIDLREIQNRLCEHPLVRSAGVRRRLPSELLIEVEERIPAAIVRNGADYIVDREGFVLGHAPNIAAGALPRLQGMAVVGGRVELASMEDLGAGLELVSVIRSDGFPSLEEIDFIDVGNPNDAVIVPLRGRPLVHVGRNNIAERLKRWRQVSADIISRWQALEYIDLRVDGQVVAKPVLSPSEGEEDKG